MRERRREARGERREANEERGKRREEREERGGEKRTERKGERREQRGEKREKRKEERRQDDPGPKFPHWCRTWGVVIFAMYVSRVRVAVRGSHQGFAHVSFANHPHHHHQLCMNVPEQNTGKNLFAQYFLHRGSGH